MEIIKRGDWQPPTFSAEIECYAKNSIKAIDKSSPVCYTLNINTGLLILRS